MYLTVQGLVLRIVPYKDTDAILTLLTAEHGKLSVKARGLKRKSSPLIAPCQLLTHSTFTLFEYRGMYTINEASVLEMFQPLRKNLSKLSLGTYFAQVAEVISQEDISNPELLMLVLNSLYALSQLDLSEMQVKAAFEMRSACLAGYMPDLNGCHRCGAAIPDRFDIAEGRLECASCRDPYSDGIRMPVSPGMLDAMRYICGCELKKMLSFRSGDETLENLSYLTESYLTTQLERSFSTLDFYKSLQNPL